MAYTSDDTSINRPSSPLQAKIKPGQKLPWCNPHVVFPPRVVKFGETPVDQAELPLLMINHNVVRLHISMHYTIRVAKLKSDQQLIDIVSVINNKKMNLNWGNPDTLKKNCVNEASKKTLRWTWYLNRSRLDTEFWSPCCSRARKSMKGFLTVDRGQYPKV